MDTYFFLFEVEPLSGNMVGAHASRAVAHIWLESKSIEEARDAILEYFKTNLWGVIEEKQAYLPTPQQVDELDAEAAVSRVKAETEGIQTTFYYYHRSD